MIRIFEDDGNPVPLKFHSEILLSEACVRFKMFVPAARSVIDTFVVDVKLYGVVYGEFELSGFLSITLLEHADNCVDLVLKVLNKVVKSKPTV